MPGKMDQCGYCRKVMRSDNLKNHIKTHDKSCSSSKMTTLTRDISLRKSINSGSGVSRPSSGSKIRVFLDEIINDGAQDEEQQHRKHVVKTSIRNDEPQVKKRKNDEFEDEKQSNQVVQKMNEILAKHYTDDNSEYEDVKELDKGFVKLFHEDKIGNREELVYILSGMLYLDYITLDDFLKVSKAIFSVKERKVEEMDDESLIQATISHVTKGDKAKLKKLIEQFKNIERSDKVLELEKVINDDKYYFDEDYDRILDYLRKLQNTKIPRTELMEFEMSLNKMRKNHYRVFSILKRLKDIEDEERFAEKVKSLAQEELISHDTFNKLLESDAVMELKNVVDILKKEYDLETGKGLYLTPRFV